LKTNKGALRAPPPCTLEALDKFGNGSGAFGTNRKKEKEKKEQKKVRKVGVPAQTKQSSRSGSFCSAIIY
jgi:hypothetical protein